MNAVAGARNASSASCSRRASPSALRATGEAASAASPARRRRAIALTSSDEASARLLPRLSLGLCQRVLRRLGAAQRGLDRRPQGLRDLSILWAKVRGRAGTGTLGGGRVHERLH